MIIQVDPQEPPQQPPPTRMFALRPRFLLRLAFSLIALILLIGIAAPYVDADAYRPSIQTALEETFGRKVDIEKVRFSLFTGPGFTLERVTIFEDPHFGLEPFAFIPTLEVRVRLDKLLLGEIRPLGLRLVDASLNLVKSDDGTWNAVALAERLGAPRRTPFNFFPAVQISNGRVDFQLGIRKTIFYLTETDLSIYPESSGKIYFKFEGSPARTDRAGNGFGHLTGTANWYLKPAPESGNQLEADVNLQPSNLSELATLFQGQDLGVHGNVSAHVAISAPCQTFTPWVTFVWTTFIAGTCCPRPVTVGASASALWLISKLTSWNSPPFRSALLKTHSCYSSKPTAS